MLWCCSRCDETLGGVSLTEGLADECLLRWMSRGVDIVRNKIKMFAQKKVTLPPGRHKVIILDEADRYPPLCSDVCGLLRLLTRGCCFMWCVSAV